MIVTENNFKDFIGINVEVEICGYSGGFMTPEDNQLIGFFNGEWVFSSPDISNPALSSVISNMWSFKESEGWSIEIESKKGGQ